jgi:trigger factor
MNVQIEIEPHCVTTLKIELPPETVSEASARVVNDFQKMARVPGFRQGKVPSAIVQSRFKKQIGEEIERALISDACRKAIRDKELRVLSVGEVRDVNFAQDQSMRFTVKIITVPDFELPEYKGLTVRVPSEAVEESEIEVALSDLRNQHANFTDIADRPLGWDDFAVIDYSGTVDGKSILEAFPEAGAPLDGREDFWIRLTKEAFLPGFSDQLVGAAIGETRTVTVAVPDDFPVKEMVGASLEYAVRVKSIKERILPELDDAFANEVLKGATMERIREMAVEELGRTKKSRIEREKRNQLIDQLLGAVTCDLPHGMVRNETRRILSEIVEENMARGVADEVLKEHEEKLLGAASRSAESRVKSTFVLLKIAEREKIEVTKEDLGRHLMGMATRIQMPVQKLLKEIEKRDAIDQIRQEVLTGKTLDFLAENVTVETVAVNPAV